MTGHEKRSACIGAVIYLAVTFGLSWIAAAVADGALGHLKAPVAVRLLASSVLYALCMGWQPLVAVAIVRRWIDRYDDSDVLFRPVPFAALAGSIAMPVALVASAMGVSLGLQQWLTERSEASSAPLSEPFSLDATLFVSVAVWTAALLMWLQTVGEEVGWRGYFLVRLMRLLGPWAGLVFHGAVWGLWYAPIILIANGDARSSAVRSVAFVITCCLLGTLLGWLRLASRSLVPTTIANSLLTLVAGLPLVLRGDDPGLRAAAYGPPGWVPMAVFITLLALSRLRGLVRIPQAPGNVGSATCVAPPSPTTTLGDRTLH